MADVSFRKLGGSDYNKYKDARLSCLKQYPDNFGTTYEEEQLFPNEKLRKAIQLPGTNNFVLGAFSSNKNLIGMCGFISETRLKTRHRGEIVQLFVEPAYSGQGIGEKLLRMAIDEALQNKQINQIILSVVSTNEKAVRLYKEIGFSEYGRLENYFRSDARSFTQSFFFLTRDCIRKQAPEERT